MSKPASKNTNVSGSDHEFDWWDNKPKGKSKYTPCYQSHPPLELPDGNVIYGGSCLRPVVKDADVYVGFDRGMQMSLRSQPWRKGTEFLIPIKDMGLPEDFDDFDKGLDYVKIALDKGMKVHCGCIGGHGRTGTFFSALVAKHYGIEDATNYVRKGYCKKAVESLEQVDFLHAQYGVLQVKPAKAAKRHASYGFQDPDMFSQYPTMRRKTPKVHKRETGFDIIKFQPGHGQVW